MVETVMLALSMPLLFPVLGAMLTPKSASVPMLTDGGKVEGGDCRHSNFGSASHGGTEEVPWC